MKGFYLFFLANKPLVSFFVLSMLHDVLCLHHFGAVFENLLYK